MNCVSPPPGKVSHAMTPELPYDIDVGFDRHYGLEVLEIGDGLARGRTPVRPELLQPVGLVHGGVYAAIAESLSTNATAAAVLERGDMAMGLSNQTNFLRPLTEGVIHTETRARHRGRTTWVWEAEHTDDAGRLVALTRVTVAVRPRDT